MENMSLMMTTLISSFSVFLHFLWLSRGWLNPPEIKGRRCGAGEKVSLQSKLWLTLSLGVSWDLANNRHHIRLSVHMSPCHNIEIISPGIRHLPNRALRTFIHFLDSCISPFLLSPLIPIKSSKIIIILVCEEQICFVNRLISFPTCFNRWWYFNGCIIAAVVTQELREDMETQFLILCPTRIHNDSFSRQ